MAILEAANESWSKARPRAENGGHVRIAPKCRVHFGRVRLGPTAVRLTP
jgi:hypothetical protein